MGEEGREGDDKQEIYDWSRMQEIVRMQKVMNLSAFQQSPLAAIRQHVQNTFGSSS